jgi:hypothetical protein
MNENLDRIEDLIRDIKLMETDNNKLYSETKRLIGWPLVGQIPSNLTEDQETEALLILKKWMGFLKTLNQYQEVANQTVRSKYKLYKGEEQVPVEKVTVGKTISDSLHGDRALDL